MYRYHLSDGSTPGQASPDLDTEAALDAVEYFEASLKTPTQDDAWVSFKTKLQ